MRKERKVTISESQSIVKKFQVDISKLKSLRKLKDISIALRVFSVSDRIEYS